MALFGCQFVMLIIYIGSGDSSPLVAIFILMLRYIIRRFDIKCCLQAQDNILYTETIVHVTYIIILQGMAQFL